MTITFYLSTAKNHGINAFDALPYAFKGKSEKVLERFRLSYKITLRRFMSMLLTAVLVKLSNDLYQLASKETASYVTEKIKTMRNDKDLTIVRSTYDELLSRLLDERAEAIRIAQVYKEELEKVSISDKDIEYLHNTVSSFLKMLSHFSQNSEENPFNDNTADLINSLISKDVLKSMQLIGFNYKEAIGDPLTKLCADKISSFASNKTRKK